MQIQTSDLLPTLYDRIVENLTRIKLTQAQRTAILITLITSLRQSAMADSKDYISTSPSEKLFALSLLTADRFTSKWLSRDELLERISKGASLDRHLTSIALLLIEARVDISLEAAKTLFVEGFGGISDASKDEKYASINSDLPREINDRAEWAREALRAVRHDSERESVWLQWFKPTSRYLAELGENLEMSATFRAPFAYRILCSSNGESSQPLKISWGSPSAKSGVVRNWLKK